MIAPSRQRLDRLALALALAEEHLDWLIGNQIASAEDFLLSLGFLRWPEGDWDSPREGAAVLLAAIWMGMGAHHA